MDHVKMEQLQILKYWFRNDRLSFTEDLLCTEEELSVIDLSPEKVDELISTGRIEELADYIRESYEGWGLEEEEEEDEDDD
jgi:hypothetical protein